MCILSLKDALKVELLRLGHKYLMSHNRQSSAPLPPKKNKITSSHSHESLNHPFQCPICQEEMISLAQLNQHLDDSHTQEKSPKVAIKDWLLKPLKPLKKEKEKVEKSDKTKESFTGIKERVLKRSESNFETSGTNESLSFISLFTSNNGKSGEREQTSCTKCSKTLGLIYGRVNCLL